MYSLKSKNKTKKGRFKFSVKGLLRRKKLLAGIGIFLLVVVLGGYFLVIRPFQRIQAKANEVADEARLLKEDLKSNDIDLMNQRVSSVQKKYDELQSEAQAVYWASFIPYVHDFKMGIEAGDYLLVAAADSIEAISPYADLIGLRKGEKSFSEQTAEERLQTAVLTLDKLLPKVDKISASIEEAEKRIETIDPERYPKKIGGFEPQAQVQLAKDQFEGAASLFVDAKPFLKQLPAILGAEEEQTYLILFQNTAERRATGGFFTFWAEFNVNKGKLTVKNSSDIYDIDNNIPSHPAAPEEILKYHKDVSRFYIRDSNLSPDFVESMKLFNSLYENAGNRVNYDGVIALDSHVLVDMLRIFGDTQVNGVNFSAENDERCDCPQAIYTLFDIVDRPVPYIKVDRKRILGNLMLELFYKAIGFSPSRYWGQLAQTMFENLDQKHIILYFNDPEIQEAVERLNYAGRIRETNGDYLHINNVNFAGAKSNLFVRETVTSETTFDSGKVKRKVNVLFTNPHPHSDCNLERGGLCLNATLRNWIRIYVPKGSKLINFKGSRTEVETYDELGKTVYEGFLTVDPQGKAEVTVEYELPSNITKEDYSLLIQKQPGVEEQEYKVDVEGKEVYDGILDTDKAL